MKVTCLRSRCSEEMNTFHHDGYQRGMWSMNIQVFFPPLGQPGGIKMSEWRWQTQAGLYGLCLVRSLLARTACAKRLRWSKKQIRGADRLLFQTSWYQESLHTDEQQTGASQGAATVQRDTNRCPPAHMHRPAVMSCGSDTKKKKKKNLQWKLKACFDRRVSFLISKSD